MFSALKKLTRGGDERGPSTVPARMPSSLQKKFSKGVHYNMKILIKGDRNVGKSCLLQRLQGGPFIEDYVPTEQIQAAAIHWTYKNTDHIVKVEVWEVVDKARSKKKAPLGLKLENAATSSDVDSCDAPALDATFLDVYKDTSGVILMMDITKPWTFEYVVKELSSIPADLPLVLLGNHCDMQHHRQVHSHHIEQALHQARQTRVAPVRYAESSMRNGFGLRMLHKFLNVPFLRLQRTTLLQQLQSNQKDSEEVERELNQFQNSDESNYVLFVERLASKRRAGAGAGVGEHSPSIVLGAGKPILPPHANPLMASSLNTPLRVSPEPTQSGYVSAELLAPKPTVSYDTTPSKISQTSSKCTPMAAGPGGDGGGGRRAAGGGGGELDEFYAGALDSSFLEDSSMAGTQHTHTNYDSDSDEENAMNPMVASAQDDLDDNDYHSTASAHSAPAPGLERPPIALEQLMGAVSLDTRRQSVDSDRLSEGSAAALGSHCELWAGTARRSPEGGEDPDASTYTEPPSLKEEKKAPKKSKKSKNKSDSEKSERKEKKHKHKKSKSEKKQQGLLLSQEEQEKSAHDYDSI